MHRRRPLPSLSRRLHFRGGDWLWVFLEESPFSCSRRSCEVTSAGLTSSEPPLRQLRASPIWHGDEGTEFPARPEPRNTERGSPQDERLALIIGFRGRAR